MPPSSWPDDLKGGGWPTCLRASSTPPPPGWGWPTWPTTSPAGPWWGHRHLPGRKRPWPRSETLHGHARPPGAHRAATQATGADHLEMARRVRNRHGRHARHPRPHLITTPPGPAPWGCSVCLGQGSYETTAWARLHRLRSAMVRPDRVASLLKRWVLDTHQGSVNPRYLQHYLDEFTFRYNP